MSFQADVSSIEVKKNRRHQELIRITDRGDQTVEIAFPELADCFLMVDIQVRDRAIVLEVLDWRDGHEHPPRKEIVLYEYPNRSNPCEELLNLSPVP